MFQSFITLFTHRRIVAFVNSTESKFIRIVIHLINIIIVGMPRYN